MGDYIPHQPVLLEEAMAWLAVRPGGSYCDGTVGYAGHARALLERSGPDGRLFGIDRDTDALAAARGVLADFGDRVSLVHATFATARDVLERLGVVPLDGFLVDLGVSSPQLDRAERGFSFRASGPLDMRMDRSAGETAADLLRRVGETELAAILRDFGEERYARRIARAVVEAYRTGRGPGTTTDLAAMIARAVPRREQGRDPATRTFQALRIAVNREIEELDRFLEGAAACLRPGGRLVVIAFHSLEDRIVKHRLRAAHGTLRVLTRRPVEAGEAERARNPRSRSAKLRAAERIA